MTGRDEREWRGYTPPATPLGESDGPAAAPPTHREPAKRRAGVVAAVVAAVLVVLAIVVAATDDGDAPPSADPAAQEATAPPSPTSTVRGPVSWSDAGLAYLKAEVRRQFGGTDIVTLELTRRDAGVYVAASGAADIALYTWDGFEASGLHDSGTGFNGRTGASFDLAEVSADAVRRLVRETTRWLRCREQDVRVEVGRYQGTADRVTVVVDCVGKRGDGRLIGFLDGTVRNRLRW